MSPLIDNLARREATHKHVPSKSLTPWSRRMLMDLPLYSCSCGAWSSERFDGFREHFEAAVRGMEAHYDNR